MGVWNLDLDEKISSTQRLPCCYVSSDGLEAQHGSVILNVSLLFALICACRCVNPWLNDRVSLNIFVAAFELVSIEPQSYSARLHSTQLMKPPLEHAVCPKCPSLSSPSFQSFPNNAANQLEGGCLGFLVLPTAPAWWQKAGRIVMQQFSDDE